MTVNERVHHLRKNVLHLNQMEFAAALHFRQTTVCMMEKGKQDVNARTIEAICRTWSVREEWLRTGEGEIFSSPLLPREIAALPLSSREGMEQAVQALFASLEPEARQAFLQQYRRGA